MNLFLLQRYDRCGTPSNRILKDSSASTIQAHLILCFPILLQVSMRQCTGVLQGIAAGIGTSNFLRAFFMVCLNSSSSGPMKKIPRICLALSSFGFSIVHFCFALFVAASDICFHISGHTLPSLEVVCFLVSKSPPGPCLSVRWPFVQQMNLVKPVHASDNSLSPSTSQSSSIFFSNNTSCDVCVVLATSMYFNGIGFDSSLGMYSLTLGST